jgi:hypothetical protein
MPGMTPQQIHKVVYGYIGVDAGYLGDFTYATHEEFYSFYCDLDDIDPRDHDGTTRQRFMKILASLPPIDQAKVLRGVVERFPVDAPGPASRTERLRKELLRIASELEGIQVPGGVGADRASVARAIADAEVLLRSNGPVSAIDRVHTALHGYLIAACVKAGITCPPEPTMTKLLKLLRSEHPRLKDLGSRSADIERVLNSFGNVLDAMNPLRNQASVAHPNESLLGDAEARLVLNGATTILVYVDEKLTDQSDSQPAAVPAYGYPMNPSERGGST